jgi:hypothetical protein
MLFRYDPIYLPSYVRLFPRCRQSETAFMTTKRKLLFSLVLLLEALLIALALTQRFPPSGDDYSYLYQAKLLASGKICAEDPLYDQANPLHHCVATNCMIDDQGRRFSKYPPGWPALLALGALLGVPWLIDPVLGAVLGFLVLRYVEQHMEDNLVKVAGLLLTLCLFFCYYAASLRAHIATALFVFSAFVAYEAARKHPGRSWLLLFGAGALLGYSSVIRYIDWVPLAAWIGVSLLRRKRFAELTLFGVGFGLLASGNLLYDSLVSGDPFQIPIALDHSPGPHDHLMVSWTGLLMTGLRLVNLLWVFPPAVLLVVLWRRYQPSPRVKLYLGLFLMNIGIYFFYPHAAGGPGPRYLLAYFPFLVLAVVDVYGSICHDCAPGPRRLWKFAIFLQIVGSISFATIQGYVSYCQRDLERTARQAGDGEKIFFLSRTYHARAADLTQNPPVLSSATSLYFDCNWDNELERDALLKRFPGRRVFVYEYPARLYQVADSQ